MDARIDVMQERVTNRVSSTRASKSNFIVLKFLILREYWEYKNLYLWLPVVMSFILFALTCNAGIASLSGLSPEELKDLTQIIAISKTIETLLIPMLGATSCVAFYHLMGALQSDRADRSILFWKSMPIADWQVVFSKIVFPIFLGPMMTLIMGMLAYLFACAVVCIVASSEGGEGLGQLFSSAAFWQDPWQMTALMPTYILWTLPAVGWICMVSAWTKSRVFPWVLGVPFLLELLLIFGNGYLKLNIDTLWWTCNLFLRIIGGLLPGMWVVPDSHELMAAGNVNFFSLNYMYERAFHELTGLRLWLGVLLGCAMVFVAIRQRRYADVI